MIGPDGKQREIPPRVYEMMQFAEEALRQGYAVQVTALRTELPIDEAAGTIGMSRDTLRSYVADGEIPFRSSEHVDWVKLADVLAFDERLRTQRRQVLDKMLNESEAVGKPASAPEARKATRSGTEKAADKEL